MKAGTKRVINIAESSAQDDNQENDNKVENEEEDDDEDEEEENLDNDYDQEDNNDVEIKEEDDDEDEEEDDLDNEDDQEDDNEVEIDEEDDDDDEETTVEEFAYEGFQFKYTASDSCDYPESLTYFSLEMSVVSRDSSVPNLVIGNANGCLVNMENSMGNLFSVVDSDSAELLEAGCLCFDNVGEIREPMRSQLVDLDSASERDGFLYIKGITIIEEERGIMLSLTLLRALFDFKAEDFSISCIFPVAWGEEDRKRREVDPLRDVKIQKIARLFSRLGYRQIGISDYMFLEKSQLKEKLVKVKNGNIMTYAPSHYLQLHKPDLSASDNELVQAIINKDLVRVKKAIINGADVKKTWALQRCACSDEKLNLLKYLLECGVDVNHQDHLRQTALMVASITGAVEAVTELLRNGADRNLLNCDDLSASDLFEETERSHRDFMTAMGIDTWNDNSPVRRNDNSHVRIREMLNRIVFKKRNRRFLDNDNIH